MTKFGMCCPIMKFTRMHRDNYYIKDLGNNAVCERPRAEAYQSTARSLVYTVVYSAMP